MGRVNNPEYEAAKVRIKYLEDTLKKIVERSKSQGYYYDDYESDRDIVNGMVIIAEEALCGR